MVSQEFFSTKPAKSGGHRALADIKESILELNIIQSFPHNVYGCECMQKLVKNIP